MGLNKVNRLRDKHFKVVFPFSGFRNVVTLSLSLTEDRCLLKIFYLNKLAKLGDAIAFSNLKLSITHSLTH